MIKTYLLNATVSMLLLLDFHPLFVNGIRPETDRGSCETGQNTASVLKDVAPTTTAAVGGVKSRNSYTVVRASKNNNCVPSCAFPLRNSGGVVECVCSLFVLTGVRSELVRDLIHAVARTESHGAARCSERSRRHNQSISPIEKFVDVAGLVWQEHTTGVKSIRGCRTESRVGAAVSSSAGCAFTVVSFTVYSQERNKNRKVKVVAVENDVRLCEGVVWRGMCVWQHEQRHEPVD